MKNLLLLLLAVTCSAKQAKNGEVGHLQKELEQTVAKDLDAFGVVEAPERAAMYEVPLKIMRQVQESNVQLLDLLEPIEELIVSLGSKKNFRPVRDIIVQSHYQLETVREWAEKRLQVRIPLGDEAGNRRVLEHVRDQATAAREALDDIAKELGKGVKKVKEDAKKNGSKIRSAAEKIDTTIRPSKLILLKNVSEAVDMLEKRTSELGEP